MLAGVYADTQHHCLQVLVIYPNPHQSTSSCTFFFWLLIVNVALFYNWTLVLDMVYTIRLLAQQDRGSTRVERKKVKLSKFNSLCSLQTPKKTLDRIQEWGFCRAFTRHFLQKIKENIDLMFCLRSNSVYTALCYPERCIHLWLVRHFE